MGTRDIQVRVTGELRDDIDVQLITATLVEIALEISAHDEEPQPSEPSCAVGRTEHFARKANES